jgi:phosphoribosylamine--glycine ligase
MKIAIIGSGGREHALAATISKSSHVNKIFCIPGNA